MLVIGVLGLQNGDPRKLVYGKNYNSQVCVSPAKYVYYPRINEDMYGIVMSGGQIDYDKIPFYGICLDACPMEGDWVCDNELKNDDGTVFSPKTPGATSVLDDCVSKTFAKGGAFLYKDVRLHIHNVQYDS